MYKRQPLTSLADEVRVITCGTLNLRAEANTSSAIPVSYTHLDVYKRQDEQQHDDDANQAAGMASASRAASAPVFFLILIILVCIGVILWPLLPLSLIHI